MYPAFHSTTMISTETKPASQKLLTHLRRDTLAARIR